VLSNKLYFAHRWGQTGDIVYGTFDGSQWSGAIHIYGGESGGALQSIEPVIASDNGILHLIHQRPNDSFIWWDYFNGCQWAGSEVSLGSFTSTTTPAIAQGGPGLEMITTSDHDNLFGLISRFTDSTVYTHPRSIIIGPPGIPTCGIVVQPSF